MNTLAIALHRIPHSTRISRFSRPALRSSQSSMLIQSPSTRLQRSYATSSAVEAPEYLSEGERKIFDIIKDELAPEKLDVQDISGGCGSMYALDIVSAQFAGLPVIKQHRLVNKVLGEEIKKWHGVQLKTKAP